MKEQPGQNRPDAFSATVGEAATSRCGAHRTDGSDQQQGRRGKAAAALAKPWARYEIGFINHDKFRAIPSNAICLWLEGKNYADTKQTDGLLPDYEVKHWRFYSKRNVDILLTSCGQKPGTDQPYAPLWEVHPVGFKMHDYLDHNDCREAVLARIARSEDERQKDRDRKASMRAAKAAKREDVSGRKSGGSPTGHLPDFSGQLPDTSPDSPRIPARVREKSGSYQRTENREQIQNEEQKKSGGGKRPIYTSDRFAVFEWQLEELERILGPHYLEFDLHHFFDDLSQRSRADGLVIPKGDVWGWLQSQVLSEARRRGLPIATAEPSTPTNKRIAGLVAGGQAFLNRSRA